MQSRGKRPEQGHKVGTWTFEKVPHGTFFSAFLAGPAHGVFVHTQGPSKPCLRVLLGERATCAGCDGKIRRQWLGYVPLWNDQGKPVVVGIKEYHEEQVSKIGFKCAVRVSRGKEYRDSVMIQEMKGHQRYVTDLPDRRVAVDLSSWLVRLWRMPELESALKLSWNNPAPIADVIPAPDETDSGNETTEPWVRRVQDLAAQSVGAVDFPNLARTIAGKQNGQHESGNGKPPRKPK